MKQGGKGRFVRHLHATRRQGGFVRREHYSWTERSAIAFLADDR